MALNIQPLRGWRGAGVQDLSWQCQTKVWSPVINERILKIKSLIIYNPCSYIINESE